MTDPRVVLRGEQLGMLELILSGLLGHVDGYRLPGDSEGGWPVVPTLRSPQDARQIVLTDADNTPLATVVVDRSRSDGEDSWWVSGTVHEERRAEHGIARAQRLTVESGIGRGAVVLIAGRFSPADAESLRGEVGTEPLDAVVVGPADSAAAARLLQDVEDWGRARGGTRVWYLPDGGAGHDGIDVAAAVLASMGAAHFVDLRHHVARRDTGAVVLFTGLSGAGKSTIARALVERISSSGIHRPVLLDGDDVRHELSAGLGFGREDRERNLRRIAWVAARVAEGGGLAVCAPIAPFASSRDMMRAMVEPVAPFLVVYVSTPLAVAESRDRKGLYAKARAGLIEDFTGIDSPYETPTDADLVLDTSTSSIEECVAGVLAVIAARGESTTEGRQVDDRDE